ncbi:MAG: LLM class flavin-dependent oxidoreductase [Acidimicrobiia bacterium]|nr:LLM class flavin-dependent oxidoreductase [Acidimicrobiia bacterium]
MKLAISPTLPGLGAGDIAQLCRQAEAIGYSEAWIAEVAGPESFATAAAIAAATEDMTIGTAVVPATTRTPALLAMAAATVSQVAGGRRFSLGIGASSELIVSQWHGQSFDRPLRWVRETVEATRAALAGQRDYAGQLVTMGKFSLTAPAPGPIDLYVGALNPAMLRVAGAVGDGVCLNLMAPEVVGRQLVEIEAGAQKAGRALPDDFGVMARLHIVVNDDVDEARQIIRAAFGPYFAQPVYNRFLGWCGFSEAAEAIAAAFAAGDRNGVAAALSDEVVDAVALVGPLGRVKDRLVEYADAGIGTAALNAIAPSGEAVLAALRSLL